MYEVCLNFKEVGNSSTWASRKGLCRGSTFYPVFKGRECENIELFSLKILADWGRGMEVCAGHSMNHENTSQTSELSLNTVVSRIEMAKSN